MTALLIAGAVVAYLWIGVVYVRRAEWEKLPATIELRDAVGLGVLVATWPLYAGLQLLGRLVTRGR